MSVHEEILDEIAHRAGLVRKVIADVPPIFVHTPTAQEFILVPNGAFAMGMSGVELRAALREVAYDPDNATWRDAHARVYGAARPTRLVTVQAFLIGRSPLLAQAAISAGSTCSTHETAKHSGPNVAAAMRADAALAALEHYGWTLPSEAQWEYVARAGGRDSWAGGVGFRAAIGAQVHDPRFSGGFEHCNAWGVWGLGLGEWIADDWHDDYTSAPQDGSAWREKPGPPTVYRGGGVLHAPWQDADEAFACHAAARGWTGAWRGAFVARPVIALPWLKADVALPAIPAAPPWEDAVRELEAEIRAEREDRRRADEERRVRHQRLRSELPGSVKHGTIRSVGDGGVYIVRLPEANGVLRLPPDAPNLFPGDRVTVRVVGTGGVPDVELLSFERVQG